MSGKNRWVWLVLGGTLSVWAGTAVAQPPVPGGAAPRPPAVSPYLNLLRSGNSTTLNYYGLVRPEQQFRQSIGNLQGGLNANQQAIGGVQADLQGLPTTGHPTQFLNYGGYFLSGGGASRVGGGVGMQRPNATTAPPPRR